MASTVRRNDLEVANYLIVETPEYFIDTEIFTKNRFESYQPDLKLDKLAVPLLSGEDPENIEIPEDRLLESIISIEYPFSFELVGKGFSEDLMKKAGFQYVLRFLHGEESTLKTLLDYSEEAVNPTATTYKFYFKHLVTGDVYLGESWDGQADWQSALNVHLSNMKKRLKVE